MAAGQLAGLVHVAQPLLHVKYPERVGKVVAVLVAELEAQLLAAAGVVGAEVLGAAALVALGPGGAARRVAAQAAALVGAAGAQRAEAIKANSCGERVEKRVERLQQSVGAAVAA